MRTKESHADSQGPTPEIAIVGMSCLFPEAPDLATFWSNIVKGRDCTRDVSDAEWPVNTYYDPGSRSFNRLYCKRGGFITDLADFDPLQYGVMPNSINGADPDQLLALKVASEALADAGYDKKTFNKERASIILGRTSAPGGGMMNMIQLGTTVDQMIGVIATLNPQYSPEQLKVIAEALESSLNPCSSDTIPGVMPNVMAGRIAGRLGFKGRSLILDAACASSLVAVELGMQDLRSGLADLVLAGGIHINSFAVFYQMFCGLAALSHQEIIRPFDDQADGTLLGEGAGVVVLKRLSNAIRDQDRIYAIIRGIGTSSDGHGTSMLAPSVEGEALAIERAYEMAGVSPQTVELLEAHGTATAIGDVVEMKAIERVFGNGQHHQQCAIGSVKSNIGHCQAASGVAGLIKTALALYHRLLPPTINVTTPNKQIDWQTSPCYINTKARAWIHANVHAKVDRQLITELETTETPRRAGVSAFGFGGVNAHCVLEEFNDEHESDHVSFLRDWDSEVCLFSGKTLFELKEQLNRVSRYLTLSPATPLRDVAYTLGLLFSDAAVKQGSGEKYPLAIVASASSDLKEKIDLVLAQLDAPTPSPNANSYAVPNNSNIYFAASDEARRGRLAFVLPGLGAAYPNMLAELCLHFPDVRAVFDFVDQLALANGSRPPSEKVFPIAGRVQSTISAGTLASMDSAVVMVLMAEWALYTVLEKLGIKPDALVGASTGEFATLNISGASNIISAAPMFYRLSTKVAQSVPQDELQNLRTLKVDADASLVEPLIASLSAPVYLCASMSGRQCLISGDKEAIGEAQKLLKAKEIVFHQLPIAIPYHTPLVEGHLDADQDELKRLPLNTPKMSVWSCSTASEYPQDLDALRQITTQLFTRPIRLKETIEKMYASGITKFIEVGPKGALTPMINEILEGRAHLAAATNLSVGSAIAQLNHLIASLACHDVHLDLNFLYQRRNPQQLDFNKAPAEKRSKSMMRLSLRYPEISISPQAAEPLKSLIGTNQSDNLVKHTASDKSDQTLSVGNEELVLQQYISNLGVFHQNILSMQQQVMATYLSGTSQETAISSANSRPLPPGTYYPLLKAGLGNVICDDKSAVLQAVLTIDQHRYLLDHAIGGNVSLMPSPEQVFLLPLMVALEIMAEAGSLLQPGKLVTRFENIKALRRIRVSRNGCQISIVAVKNGKDQNLIDAEIYVRQEGAEESIEEPPAMSCQITFDTGYQSPPQPIRVENEFKEYRAPHLKASDLYGQNAMFHGPRLQSVREITKVGHKQILGVIEGKEASDWLSSAPTLEFLTNPLLLDNATQLVLFHLYEHNEPAHALLPFFVDSLSLYRDLNKLRGPVTVFAQLTSITQRGTEANVFLLDAAGNLIAEFKTICSRRISLDDRWSKFIKQPSVSSLGKELLEILPNTNLWSAVQISEDHLPEDDVTLSWCVDYLLHQQEQRFFERNFKNGQRKREWLMGRIAAKEAVRNLIMRLTKLALSPADILIGNDELGKPLVFGEFVESLGFCPLISIAHKNGTTIATAAHPQVGLSIGVDCETIESREEGFEKLAFTQNEQVLLHTESGAQRDKMISFIWAAKEAAGKALGCGLRNNPKSIEISDIAYTGAQTYIANATPIDLPGMSASTTVKVSITVSSSEIIAIAILQPLAVAAH